MIDTADSGAYAYRLHQQGIRRELGNAVVRVKRAGGDVLDFYAYCRKHPGLSVPDAVQDFLEDLEDDAEATDTYADDGEREAEAMDLDGNAVAL